MLEYYGNNDYRDYLAHHGIIRMKWGERHGPPYPLDYGDHSAAEKRGMAEKGVAYLGSEGSVSTKRKRSLKEILEQHREKKRQQKERDEAEAKTKAEEAVKARKKAIADRAVETENMAELKNSRTASLFTDDEVREIAKRVDDHAKRREMIDSRSTDVRDTVERNQRELKKKAIADRAVKTENMLELRKRKNAELFSKDELTEIENRIKDKQASRETVQNNSLTRKERKYDEKKQKMMRDAVKNADMTEINKHHNMFTTEELNQITGQVDARAKELQKTAVRSGKNGDAEYKKRVWIEKGDVKKILKNADLFTTDELNEAVQKFGAKQKLADARRDARLKTIADVVHKGATMSKDVSDIMTNVSNIKKAIDTLTGKSSDGQNDIQKALNSADKNKINQVWDKLDSNQKKEALNNIERTEKFKSLLDANQRSNGGNGGEGSQNSQQGGKQQKGNPPSDKDANAFDKFQNESKSSEPRQPSNENGNGSAYDRMMSSWRSADVKPAKGPSSVIEGPSTDTKLKQMADSMKASSKVDKAFSKAMDQEIKKYSDMSKGLSSKVAKKISALQTKHYTTGEFKSESEKLRKAEEMAEWTREHRKPIETREAIKSLQSGGNGVSEAAAKQRAKWEADQRDTSYSRVADAIREKTSTDRDSRIEANRREGGKKAAETRKQRKETAKEVERSSQSAGSAQSLIRAFHTDDSLYGESRRSASTSRPSANSSRPSSSSKRSSDSYYEDPDNWDLPSSSSSKGSTSSSPRSSKSSSGGTSSSSRSSSSSSSSREEAMRAVERAASGGGSYDDVSRRVKDAGKALLDRALAEVADMGVELPTGNTRKRK